VVQIHPDPPNLRSLVFWECLCASAHGAFPKIQSAQITRRQTGDFVERLKAALLLFRTLNEGFGAGILFVSKARSFSCRERASHVTRRLITAATQPHGQKPTPNGAIAQLGERLPCTQEVGSSILPGSTKLKQSLARLF
jgi:hypothetical protein